MNASFTLSQRYTSYVLPSVSPVAVKVPCRASGFAPLLVSGSVFACFFVFHTVMKKKRKERETGKHTSPKGLDVQGSSHVLLRILLKSFYGPTETVRTSNTILILPTICFRVQTLPRTRETCYFAMHSTESSVSQVYDNVVVVHICVIQRMTGLNTNHGFDMTVHTSRRCQVVDWIILPTPHDHPRERSMSGELLFQPFEVRVLLR